MNVGANIISLALVISRPRKGALAVLKPEIYVCMCVELKRLPRVALRRYPV